MKGCEGMVPPREIIQRLAWPMEDPTKGYLSFLASSPPTQLSFTMSKMCPQAQQPTNLPAP